MTPHDRSRPARPVQAIALALTLLLCACYASPALLFDAAEAVQPLADGAYRRPDGTGFRVTQALGGAYRVERLDARGLAGETRRVWLWPASLAGREGLVAAAEADEGYAYAAVYVDHGRVYWATPDCADPLDRGQAVDHGARVDDDDPMTHACTFKSRTALIGALSDFAGHADFGAPYQNQ